MDLRMYILVNEDIKIGKGKLAGQVGHAVNVYVYNLCFWSDMDGRKLIIDYMNGVEIKKVILRCPQSKLEELEKAGYISIRDKGYTQLKPNTLTCVNMEIIDAESFPEDLTWIKDLKLY